MRLSLEAIRADVEEFGGKAYRMGKGSKDDAVVALLKDQLDEFKQVPTSLPSMHLSILFVRATMWQQLSFALCCLPDKVACDKQSGLKQNCSADSVAHMAGSGGTPTV